MWETRLSPQLFLKIHSKKKMEKGYNSPSIATDQCFTVHLFEFSKPAPIEYSSCVRTFLIVVNKSIYGLIIIPLPIISRTSNVLVKLEPTIP